ncbi:MAG: ABC transporter substrate-binding protein [Nocardioides sp.]
MRRSLISLALAASILLTACGTTVDGVDQSLTGQAGAGVPGSLGAPLGSDPGGLGDNGLGTDVGTGLQPEAGGVPDLGLDPGSSAPLPEGVDPSTTSGPDPTTTPSSTPSGNVGPGVTDTTIAVGIPVETGTQAAADAFGVSGASTASQEAIFNAVIADINKSGGVLGRELKPAYHPFDVGQALANPAQTAAEICADFAEDRPVLAIAMGVTTPGLRECSAKMGSPLLLMNSTASILPAAEYERAGGSYLYGINTITTERLAELYVESLLDRDFDEQWNTSAGGPGGVLPTKIAVIHVDTAEQRALYDGYEAQLKKKGYEFEERVTYNQDAASGLAATQAAILRFRSAGVTHVFGASVFFLLAAENQNYRPRYAYLPGLGQLGVDNAPRAQMNGALTVGWAPMNDVSAQSDPGPTAGAARCQAAMKASGLSVSNRSDLRVMYNACDALYSFTAALEAGKSANVAGMRAGFESFGSSFKTALSFTSSIGPGRHSGVSSVRDMAYESGCECLVYTSRANRS